MDASNQAGSGRHRRIAVAIDLHYAEPWHQKCYEGVLRYAHRKGWQAVVDPFLLGLEQRSNRVPYDGVVGRIGPDVATLARAHGLPTVNHWRTSPVKELPTVGLDYREGARLAGEHLINRGYRRFALVDLTGLAADPEREGGLRQALEAHGLDHLEVVRLPADPDNPREYLTAIRELLFTWLRGIEVPVGVLVRFSHSARALVQACDELGLRVPEDVGVVADVSNATIDESATPTISAVDYDFEEVGYQAAALLDTLMDRRDGASALRLVTPTRVIMRASSGAVVFECKLVSAAIQYIAAHCMGSLTASIVANHLDVSERTLKRRFEETLGRSVKDEIDRMRADRMKSMLIETNTPMKDIAESFGFSSAGHFTRYFTRLSGMTPTAYRAHHASDDQKTAARLSSSR
jgi:LacI family transcriptional regulator